MRSGQVRCRVEGGGLGLVPGQGGDGSVQSSVTGAGWGGVPGVQSGQGVGWARGGVQEQAGARGGAEPRARGTQAGLHKCSLAPWRRGCLAQQASGLGRQRLPHLIREHSVPHASGPSHRPGGTACSLPIGCPGGAGAERKPPAQAHPWTLRILHKAAKCKCPRVQEHARCTRL